METISKYNAVDMYRMYGIAEWNEKCLVLTPTEIQAMETDLENGISSPLVTIAQLPFPHFVAIYLQRFPTAISFANDPAIGYKLYLLPDSFLRYFVERHRHPELKQVDIKKMAPVSSIQLSDGKNFLSISLDDIVRNISSKSNNELIERKFIYLTQYIDLKEAKRLDLKLAKVMEVDGCDGYELEKKLSYLNPAARLVMAMSLGLYGEKRHSCKQIAERYNIIPDRVLKVFNFLFPMFLRPAGEMSSTIGLKNKNYSMSDVREYTNSVYRELDLALEINYIKNHLGEAEKEVLASYSERESRLYIASKYMFKTPEALAVNMCLSLEDAEKRLGFK